MKRTILLGIILVIIALGFGIFVTAENTGLKSPAATGDPSNNWTNGDNIMASDDVYTTTTTIGEALDTSNYSFDIPVNARIDGIEVRLEGGCRL